MDTGSEGLLSHFQPRSSSSRTSLRPTGRIPGSGSSAAPIEDAIAAARRGGRQARRDLRRADGAAVAGWWPARRDGVHVAPVLLGDGVRLYGGPGFARVERERIDATLSPQLHRSGLPGRARHRDLTGARPATRGYACGVDGEGRFAAAAAAVMAALALGACGGESGASDEEPRSGDPSALAFDFQLDAPLGQISQTLTIENSGETGLAPVLELTPLDASGEPIPGVTAHTAYGSDRGEVVVPPYTAVLDVVRFDGRRKRDVEDVAVRVAKADGVAAEAAGEPEIQRLDHGQEVHYESFFDSVRVTNVDRVPIESASC
jgi:hypothetical protein